MIPKLIKYLIKILIYNCQLFGQGFISYISVKNLLGTWGRGGGGGGGGGKASGEGWTSLFSHFLQVSAKKSVLVLP